MKVKVKRVDKSLPLPKYQTKGAVGFDFYARETTKIPPKKVGKVPGNVIVETPPGYMLMVASRGSTPFTKGLMPAHGVGIGDQDYCGPNDEYFLPFYNFSDQEVVVERGERIAQGIFVAVGIAEWEETDSMKHNSTRGGFGSTDRLNRGVDEDPEF